MFPRGTCSDGTAEGSQPSHDAGEAPPRGSRLQVAQLCELFPAALKLAQERFCLLVYDSMGPDIATLSEAFTTAFTGVRTFAGVTTLMCLEEVSLSIPALPASKGGCVL